MAAPAPTTPRIFVSYNRQDSAFTHRLVEYLERMGVVYWVDWEGARDGNFLKRINEGLVHSDWLVLVETPHSLKSDPVEMEVDAALNRVLYGQMRGVVRLVAAARDPRMVPPTWATLQYYDATTDFDGGVANLLAAIRAGDARIAQRPGAEHPGGYSVVAPAAAAPAALAAPSGDAGRLLTRMASLSAASDWYTVCDVGRLLLADYPDAVTTDFYRMQGRALLELGQPAEAARALTQAYQRDKSDLPTMRAAARACLQAKDTAAAEPLLLRALTEADDPDEKLDILREYAPTLESLGKREDALLRIEQALHLRRDDPAWLAARRDLLLKLNRTAEALAAAQALANRPEAASDDLLVLARLLKQQGAPEEAIRVALDRAASRASDGMVAQVAEARSSLLAPPPPAIPAARFPARLTTLGYTPHARDGVEWITPPLAPVAAGRFLMGSDPKRDAVAAQNDWAKREMPQDWVEVAAFQLGKYPVTVAEYALAVKAGTAPQPPDGSAWTYEGKTYPAVTWQIQLQRLDHPVVYVSWHDAQHYIAWLRAVTGEPGWRLPTEAEWEKAARWDASANASRIYPWGDSFDQARCNTSESGLGHTTAVGSYPASDAARSGASPWDAEDMAGNVWEWTSSLYKPYKYTVSDGREAQDSTENRVLRGGSWGGSARNARAAYRNSLRPGDRNYNCGFRLALARLSAGS